MQFIKLDVLLVFACSLLIFSCSTRSFFYVNDAKMLSISERNELIDNKNRSEPIKLLLNGHYIESGKNLVLLIRKFDVGKRTAIDDEYFEKLTIEIKKYELGKPIKLESPDIQLYYSEGPSGFIYKGHGYYSTCGSGYIIINKTNTNTLVAEINITTMAKSAGVFPSPPEGWEVNFKGKYSFKEIKISKLTPWLGVPDSSYSKEVYP